MTITSVGWQIRRDDETTSRRGWEVAGVPVWVLGQIREDAAAFDRFARGQNGRLVALAIFRSAELSLRSCQMITHSFVYTVLACSSASCLYNRYRQQSDMAAHDTIIPAGKWRIFRLRPHSLRVRLWPLLSLLSRQTAVSLCARADTSVRLGPFSTRLICLFFARTGRRSRRLGSIVHI
jgi:hypothetical protein